jgi:serine protease Do
MDENFKPDIDYTDYNKNVEETGLVVRDKTYRHKKKSNLKTYICLVLITSIISSSIVGGILYSSFSAKLNSQAAQTSSELFTNNGNSAQAVKTGTTSSSNGNMYSAVDIAKKVGPSIVGVRMTVTSSISQYFRGANQQATSEGSGIIISSDGYIMTNYHVVEYADPKSGVSSQALLEVFLPDGKQAQAKFIGGDDENDLAVIKVNLTNLPVAELGDSSKLEVGEPAVAIGNPLGMEFAGSVTVGVISALNRQVETEDKTLNLIQTDAAINPGNSGGALVNSKGQVIGINTVKISETGVEGLGFAIPVNDAKPVVQQLVKYGYVKGRPFIGISGQEITQVMSARYGLPVGIYIVDVTSGSGAQKAGIEKGDVLISLAGKTVKTMSDVNTIKKGYKAGDTVDAVIVRNGSKINVKITFSEDK